MKSGEFSPPFTEIAPYYDELMSFVKYPEWVDYIETILILNKIKEKRILELACGTGVCMELWIKKGYSVIGLDTSPPMLAVCQKRLNSISAQAGAFQLILGDMRNFGLSEKVSIVTCLYDSLNYLLSPVDLLRCFRSVYSALKANAIFIFDMNTVYALKEEWGNRSFKRYNNSIISVWENSYDPHTQISTLKLTLTASKNGRPIVLKEIHQERGYTLQEITNLLEIAGFQATLYRHLTFKPATEADLRIMGVARKR